MQQLPDICYATLPTTGEVIIVKKGVSGYIEFDNAQNMTADQLNKEIGVTPAQATAMRVGSMFGFDVPGADPSNYDAQGRPSNMDSKFFQD